MVKNVARPPRNSRATVEPRSLIRKNPSRPPGPVPPAVEGLRGDELAGCSTSCVGGIPVPPASAAVGDVRLARVPETDRPPGCVDKVVAALSWSSHGFGQRRYTAGPRHWCQCQPLRRPERNGHRVGVALVAHNHRREDSSQELRYCGVVGQHSGREDPHTSVDGQVSEQGEQSRAHAPSLPGTRDQDGYLGLVVRGASPVVPGHRDDRPVAHGHQGLSPKVIHLGQPLQRCRPRPATLQWLAEVDHFRREALVAMCDGAVVAVARYDWTGAADDQAEIAILVEDAWQRRRVGTTLLPLLTDLAIDRGVRVFTATVLANNTAVAQFLRRVFPSVIVRNEGYAHTVTIPLGTPQGLALAPMPRSGGVPTLAKTVT